VLTVTNAEDDADVRLRDVNPDPGLDTSPDTGQAAAHLAPHTAHLLAALDEGLLVLTAGGRVVEANSVAAALLGHGDDPLVGSDDVLAGAQVLRGTGNPWTGFRLPGSLFPRYTDALDPREGNPPATSRRHVIGVVRAPDVRWLSAAVARLEVDDSDAEPLWIVSVVEAPEPVPVLPAGDAFLPEHLNDDGTPPKQTDARADAFRLAFDVASIGMALVEVDEAGHGRVVRINSAMRLRSGMGGTGTEDIDVVRWIHPDDVPNHVQRFRRLCKGAIERTTYEMRYRWRDGTERVGWVHAEVRRAPTTDGEQGRVTHVIYNILDVTDRYDTERQLERLALSDTLTGLANRLRFEQQTQAAIRRAGGTRGTVGVLVLDLDRFKIVNDALGHTAGDAVLVEAGRRLRSTLPPSAVVARLGGDEFAVALGGLSGSTELVDRALDLLDELTRPYPLPDGGTVVCTASIGATVVHDSGVDVGDVYREAGLALYAAKDRGRNQCALFDDRLRASADARIEQESRLRAALDTDGVRIFLQPITDLASGRTVGAEALARLRHPTRGILEPREFVDVAEDTGLIVEIDARVAELAVDALADHPDDIPNVAVNVSPRSLASGGYVRRVSDALRHRGVPGARLLVEVTERTLMDETGTGAVGLSRLRRLGVRVGIDDFGTGYSALAYLSQFDLDFLKIDRSFVSGLGEDPRADTVVSAIVAIAHSHAMLVTAEGVESPTQAEALTKMGCDSGQGWHFGYPAPRTATKPAAQPAAQAAPTPDPV
jgi:diguanylate cyclase (GGDEF)-like protein/PAS domain S-box-containing protein